MKAPINFDLYAMSAPKSRQDCAVLAKEILAELDRIGSLIDASIDRCKAGDLAAA